MVKTSTNGPFVNRTLQIEGNNVTFNFAATSEFYSTSTLTQTQYAALLILHELGHAYGESGGDFGFFGPDANDSALNLEYTQRIMRACFPELVQNNNP